MGNDRLPCFSSKCCCGISLLPFAVKVAISGARASSFVSCLKPRNGAFFFCSGKFGSISSHTSTFIKRLLKKEKKSRYFAPCNANFSKLNRAKNGLMDKVHWKIPFGKMGTIGYGVNSNILVSNYELKT